MPPYLDALRLIAQQYGQAVLGVVIMLVMMVFVFNPMLEMKQQAEDEKRATTVELIKIAQDLKEAAQHLSQAIQIQNKLIERP